MKQVEKVELELKEQSKQKIKESSQEYYLKFSNWASSGSENDEQSTQDEKQANHMLKLIRKSKKNLKKTVQKSQFESRYKGYISVRKSSNVKTESNKEDNEIDARMQEMDDSPQEREENYPEWNEKFKNTLQMLNENLKTMKKDINGIQRSIRKNIKRNKERQDKIDRQRKQQNREKIKK